MTAKEYKKIVTESGAFVTEAKETCFSKTKNPALCRTGLNMFY